MEITKANTKQELFNYVEQAISQRIARAYYCVYDKHYVVPGVEHIPNYDYLEEHNIELFDIPTMGSTIVVSNGDIGFGLTHYTNDQANAFLELAKINLVNLIHSHNLSCSVIGNDVLIDEYKVASYCSRMCNEVCFGVFQLSVNVDLELIQNICNKPMVKIPKGLSEFGITTEELLENVVLKTAREFTL